MNRLKDSTSAYLLQHANNPVHWQPWDATSLAQAKAENKLIIVSIGYSACHWCHVMEHESFEDNNVAALMNEHFICIKIDREERPDIDQLYMSAIQLMTGSGGWPLNCITLPDGRPIYGGTYFKKENWIGALHQLAETFKNDPNTAETYAQKLTDGIAKVSNAVSIKSIDTTDNYNHNAIITNILNEYDADYGGLMGAPKFPMPVLWQYLLAAAYNTKNLEAQNAVYNTLTKIQNGGIYDHVSGGFARYSVDAEWHIPHFEKMLYDNAQLLSLYSKAYLQSKNDTYKATIAHTFDFMERELKSIEGAYYAALDADSEGVEGKYYSFTFNEIQDLLGESAALFCKYYSITEAGNFEHGMNILIKNSAETLDTETEKIMAECISILGEARKNKIRPATDYKLITSWNALAITGLCHAYTAIQNDEYKTAAYRIANFIIEDRIATEHIYRIKDEKTEIQGFADDYACTIAALLEVYQLDFEAQYLQKAEKLMEIMLGSFYNAETGFFNYTAGNAHLSHVTEIQDNVIPSANAMMAKNLLIIGSLTDNMAYITIAEKMVATLYTKAHTYPAGYALWCEEDLMLTNGLKTIVIVGEDAIKHANIEKQKPENESCIIAAGHESIYPRILKNKYKNGQTLKYVCAFKTCSAAEVL